MATAAEHRAEIDRINGEVATQAAKIAELSEILDGKASGGGASVETCTVTVNISRYTLGTIGYVNGSLELITVPIATSGDSVTETLTIAKKTILCSDLYIQAINNDCKYVTDALRYAIYVYGDASINL